MTKVTDSQKSHMETNLPRWKHSCFFHGTFFFCSSLVWSIKSWKRFYGPLLQIPRIFVKRLGKVSVVYHISGHFGRIWLFSTKISFLLDGQNIKSANFHLNDVIFPTILNENGLGSWRFNLESFRTVNIFDLMSNFTTFPFINGLVWIIWVRW